MLVNRTPKPPAEIADYSGRARAGMTQKQFDTLKDDAEKAANRHNKDAETKAAQDAARIDRNAKGEDEVVSAYDPKTDKYSVMSKGDAKEAGLFHYKVNAEKVNANAAGMDDVQNKVNMLSDIVYGQDGKNIQNGLAGAAIDQGMKLDLMGVHLDTGRINAILDSENMKSMNSATRNYVTAYLAAHEAVTQLPRLQTFGQSSRMTHEQMLATQQMLPQAGDDVDMRQRRMEALQTTLDPLRNRMPTLPGAPLKPSYRDDPKSAYSQARSQNAPKQGDTKTYQGRTYQFDGKQWKGQ
jgi:hypothetical protein